MRQVMEGAVNPKMLEYLHEACAEAKEDSSPSVRKRGKSKYTRKPKKRNKKR